MKGTALVFTALMGMGALSAAAFDDAPRGTLIGSTFVQPGDSPLVRAAKQAAARRGKLPAHSVVMIDNSFLVQAMGAHITTTKYQSDLPEPVTSTTPPPTGTPDTSAEQRAALQKKIDNLKIEQALVQHESEQPWSDEMDEGRVEQRQAQIPGELQQAQQQMNAIRPVTVVPVQPPPQP